MHWSVDVLIPLEERCSAVLLFRVVFSIANESVCEEHRLLGESSFCHFSPPLRFIPFSIRFVNRADLKHSVLPVAVETMTDLTPF